MSSYFAASDIIIAVTAVVVVACLVFNWRKWNHVLSVVFISQSNCGRVSFSSSQIALSNSQMCVFQQRDVFFVHFPSGWTNLKFWPFLLVVRCPIGISFGFGLVEVHSNWTEPTNNNKETLGYWIFLFLFFSNLISLVFGCVLGAGCDVVVAIQLIYNHLWPFALSLAFRCCSVGNTQQQQQQMHISLSAAIAIPCS